MGSIRISWSDHELERALRNSLSDTAPEVSQQLAVLQGLRAQQASLEGADRLENLRRIDA